MPTTLDVRDAQTSFFDDLTLVLLLVAVALWGVLIPLELANLLNLI